MRGFTVGREGWDEGDDERPPVEGCRAGRLGAGLELGRLDVEGRGLGRLGAERVEPLGLEGLALDRPEEDGAGAGRLPAVGRPLGWLRVDGCARGWLRVDGCGDGRPCVEGLEPVDGRDPDEDPRLGVGDTRSEGRVGVGEALGLAERPGRTIVASDRPLLGEADEPPRVVGGVRTGSRELGLGLRSSVGLRAGSSRSELSRRGTAPEAPASAGDSLNSAVPLRGGGVRVRMIGR